MRWPENRRERSASTISQKFILKTVKNPRRVERLTSENELAIRSNRDHFGLGFPVRLPSQAT